MAGNVTQFSRCSPHFQRSHPVADSESGGFPQTDSCMKNFRNLLLHLAALGASLAPLVPAAAGDLTVNGFGTVGLTYVDKPSGWAYVRSMNQRADTDSLRADLDSVVGLQLNYSPAEKLELVGQVVASALDSDAKASDYVELAFLAWRPGEHWAVRLGRVNLDAYLVSDHRDVGFTYAYIRPPVEYYSRMPTSLDGGDISRTWLAGDAQWQAKVFAGNTSAGIGGNRLHLDPLIGVMLSRESPGLLLRASAVSAEFPQEIPAVVPLIAGLQQMQLLPVPQIAAQAAEMEAELSSAGSRTYYVAAGLAYDRHDWLVTAEINRAAVKNRPSISFASGYASIGRRFGSLTVFALESIARRKADASVTPDWATPLTPLDPQLAQQAQALAVGSTMAINKSAGNQSSTSLGARWELRPRVALKAQWDHVHTSAAGDGLWAQGSGQAARSNVFGLAVDFLF